MTKTHRSAPIVDAAICGHAPLSGLTKLCVSDLAIQTRGDRPCSRIGPASRIDHSTRTNHISKVRCQANVLRDPLLAETENLQLAGHSNPDNAIVLIIDDWPARLIHGLRKQAGIPETLHGHPDWAKSQALLDTDSREMCHHDFCSVPPSF